MKREVTFSVDGAPVGQGSMRAGVNPITGRARIFHDRASALAIWRHWISAAAVEAMHGEAPMSGAVNVVLAFLLPRPLVHRTKAGELAPRFVGALPDRAPDLDKLVRAALDAMSGVVFFDDGQACSITATKQYADGKGGLVVLVSTLP